MLHRCWLTLAVVAVAAGGCSGGGGAGGDDRPDGTVADLPGDGAEEVAGDATGLEVPDGGWPVCTPGTRLQCTEDGLGEVLCNLDGTGWEAHPCGEGSVCLDDAKGCTSCVPGRVSCLNDSTVIRCDPTGTTWEVAEDCDPAHTGEVCRAGICIGLCELSDKLSSYIGCEYWGADTDNAVVGAGEGSYYDAAGAQYAIVVSNTSDRWPATVEVFTHLGKVTHDSRCNPLPADPIPAMGLRVFELPRYYPVDPTKCTVCANGPGETYPGKDCTDRQVATEMMDLDGTTLKPQAYRVKSTIPITAYQFNPFSNVGVYSNDASLLLPTNALGRYYVVMTREQTFQELKGFLSVVAVDPGETQVYVKVTAPTMASSSSDSRDVPAMQPGDERTFFLNQFDVLNIETNAYGADLTGSIVYANHPVGVFGGSEASNAPNTNHCCPGGRCEYNNQWMECASGKVDGVDCLCEWPKQNLSPSRDVSCRTNYDCLLYNTCCADHLEKMLYPVKTWGQKYVVTRSYPRGGEKDVFRILAAEDQTVVTVYPLQGTLPPVLKRGEYLEFESGENFIVTGKKPILVGQFVAAQDAPDPNVTAKGPDDANTGDPTFLMAVPSEQFRTDYVFLTPDKYRFDAVNLIVPTGQPVFLDGKELKQEDLHFRPARDILQDMTDKGLDHPWQLGVTFGDYNRIADGEWSVWRVAVKDGVHVARSEKPFGAIVYGYDRYVSYGYPAGLNLEDLKLVTEEPPR